jgi:hypothetical protein
MANGRSVNIGEKFMENKKFWKVLLYIVITSLLCLLSACSIKIPSNYSPSIVMSGKGNISVEMFRYLPAENGKLEKNQIDTKKGLHPFYTNDNIDKIITDAVMRELKYIGYTLDASSVKIISGDILEYSCNYIGFNVDHVTKIRFFIYDNSTGERKERYSKVHEGRLRLNKFKGVATGDAMNVTLSKAIESFVQDVQKENVLDLGSK